jgi:hypothetical protein
MALDKDKFVALLKRLYGKPRLDAMMLDNSPFLGMIPKKPGGGESFTLPIVYGAPQNRSANFATSKAGTDTSKQLRFIGDYTKNFQHMAVDHMTLINSMNSETSFLNAISHETDSAIAVLKRDISVNLFLANNGIIGKVANVDAINATSCDITLESKADIVRFELGMNLINPSGTKAGLITHKNYEEGKLTLSDAVATRFEADDLLVVDGDQVVSGNGVKLSGLSDWLPFGAGREAALAAPFMGVVRAKDTVKLGGVYEDASNKSISEGIRMAMAKCSLYGVGRPEVILMNPMDIFHLTNELEAHASIEKGGIKANGCSATIGYDTIQVGGILGSAKIVEDAGCPEGVAFALKLDTWEYQYLGKSYLNTWNEDGVSVLRDGENNELQGRFYSYGQIGCKSPGANAVIYFGKR